MSKQNNKNFGPTSQGVARDSFFFHFINSIHLIQFNSISLLTSLKDARTRRLTARSSRARSHGLTGPLCDGAHLTYSHELARPLYTPRRTLQEAQTCSPTSVRRSEKANKNPENSRKAKENPFGPWPSLPSAVLK
jgi:hypothetical protein